MTIVMNNLKKPSSINNDANIGKNEDNMATAKVGTMTERK